MPSPQPRANRVVTMTPEPKMKDNSDDFGKFGSPERLLDGILKATDGSPQPGGKQLPADPRRRSSSVHDRLSAFPERPAMGAALEQNHAERERVASKLGGQLSATSVALAKFKEKAKSIVQAKSVLVGMKRERHPKLQHGDFSGGGNANVDGAGRVGRRLSSVIVLSDPQAPIVGKKGQTTPPPVREHDLFNKFPRVSRLLAVERHYLKTLPGIASGSGAPTQSGSQTTSVASVATASFSTKLHEARLAASRKSSLLRNKTVQVETPTNKSSGGKAQRKGKKNSSGFEKIVQGAAIGTIVETSDDDDDEDTDSLLARSGLDNLQDDYQESDEEESLGGSTTMAAGFDTNSTNDTGGGGLNFSLSRRGGKKGKRLPMPSGNDLASLLPEFRHHLEGRAMVTLKTLLVPKYHLRQRLKQRQAVSNQAQNGAVKLSLDLLKSSNAHFSHWPDSALKVLLSHARYRLVERHEVVVYSGTPYVVGAFVVSAGQVTIISADPMAVPGTTAPADTLDKSGRGAKSGRMEKSARSGGVVAPEGTGPQFSKIIRVSAPLCAGDSVTMTEECHRCTVRANVRCDVWHLSPDAFQAALGSSGQSPTSRQAMFLNAFSARNTRLGIANPIDASQLRLNRMFSSCPTSVLEEVERNLVPKCVPKNFDLVHADNPANEILFVVSGRVAVKRKIGGEMTHLATLYVSTDWDDNNPSATAPHTATRGGFVKRSRSLRKSSYLKLNMQQRKRNQQSNSTQQLPDHAYSENDGSPAPSAGSWGQKSVMGYNVQVIAIGDTEVLHGKPFESSFTTLTAVDAFTLSKEAFGQAIRMLSNVADTIYTVMRQTKEQEMQRTILQYRDLMLRMPLLSDLVGPFSMRDFIRLFKSRVYKPMSVICSTSAYCDRVILLTKGKIRIGDSGQWSPGEFAGYTGVVPHRWAAAAVTQTETETLEIPLSTYTAFLQDLKLYQKVKEWSLHLMYPKAFPPETVVRTSARVRNLKSTVLYPISRARKVEIPQALVTGLHQAEERNRQAHGLPPLKGVLAGVGSKNPKKNGNSPERSTTVLGLTSEEGGSRVDLKKRAATPDVHAFSPSADDKAKAGSDGKILKKEKDAIPFYGMSRVSTTMWVRR